MRSKIILATIVVIGVLACIWFKPENMGEKFKKEYESLNGEKSESGKTYLDVSISKSDKIVYADYDKVFEILDGTGVIYFGFPQCPWCRNSVPILLDVIENSSIDKLYYLNNYTDRDTKVLKDDKVVTEKEGTSNYKKLLKKLGKRASVYDGLNDENIRRLYFPTVIVVKNGEITDYIEGTVESQTDPYKALTKKQKQELKNKYKKAINKLSMCSQNEKC